MSTRMSTRQPNKTITLPESGKEVVVKQYISAGLYIDLSNTPTVKRIEVLIDELVVSFDGSTENIFARIREDIDAKDYRLLEENILSVLRAATETEQEKKSS